MNRIIWQTFLALFGLVIIPISWQTQYCGIVDKDIVDMDMVGMDMMDMDMVDMDMVDMDMVDMMEMDMVDMDTVDMDIVDMDIVVIGMVDMDMVDINMVNINTVDMDLVDMDMVDMDMVDMDMVDMDMVDITRIRIRALRVLRIRIRSFYFSSISPPPPKPRNFSQSWIQRQFLPSLSPFPSSYWQRRTFLAQFDLVNMYFLHIRVLFANFIFYTELKHCYIQKTHTKHMKIKDCKKM